MVENITERKNAESALKESEEKFRNLVEQSPFAFQIYDKDGNLLQVNEAWEKMWKVKAEQVVGRYNALEDEQIKAAGMMPMLERAVNGENVILPDVEYDPAKFGMPGQKCWARTYAYSIKDSAGKIKNVIVVNEDISKRKSAEKALRESEERYRYFVQQTAEGFFRIKTDNPIPAALPFEKQLEMYLKEMYVAECNDIFARMYGYPQAEHLNGRKLTELHGGENFTDNAGGSISFIQNGYKMIDAETQEFDKDGKKVYFLNNAVGIIKDECLIEIWGTQRNITKRKLAEEAVQESEAKYRSLIQHSSDAIYLLYNRRFEVVNDKFLEMFKVDLEYVNSPDFNIMNLVAPHSHHILEERQARLDRGEKIEPKYEFTALTSEGDEFQVEASISYIDYKDGAAAQGIIRDITEAKKLEEQLRQSQKMDAVGQLAGGIAHDFNNLLTIISGYSDLLLNTQGVDVNSIEKLNQIRKAGERAQSLTNQLLAFSRRQIVRPEVLDINKVLNDSMKMYSRLIGEDIKIRLMLGENLPSILADPHQIEQILMNLLVNARDAIHAKYQENFEKIITIETSLRYLDEEYAAVHLGCKAGRKIMICISDTGAGMSKETIERVFEPFYTTKSQGKGTGLGMSTVYGIVKQNEANIYVYSEPGQGSTFKIFWPLNEAETEENDLEPREMKIIGGSEKILFVEDDDGVREFGLNALLNLGYDVQPAASAEAAMELIQTNKIDFDILITDLVMPGMSGRQLADKIQQLYKDLPVIFVSGYTDEHIVHHGVLDKDINFIQKPYSIAALAAKIRELLDD